MSQTTVDATGQKAQPLPSGSIDPGPHYIVSGTSEESATEIRFGAAVKQGTADDGVLLPTAITDDLKGVVVFAQGFSKPNELGTTGLKPKVTFGVMRRGQIWILAEGAVGPTTGVHVRSIIAGAEWAGAFRGTADGTDTRDVSAFARWLTTGSATVPALLEFDFLGM